MKTSSRIQQGFTIVELIIVVLVIAILATIVAVAYNGIQQSARDKSLYSDINSIEAELARYAVKNKGEYGPALAWDSTSGANANISFTPSEGNVVRVEVSGTDYCIRVYNPKSNKKTLTEAASKNSKGETCTSATAPVATTPFNVPLPGSTLTYEQIVTACQGSSYAPAGYNVVIGTTGIGNTTGTSGNDIIYRTSGMGNVTAGDGNDVICMGSVTGNVNGNNGNDIIYLQGGMNNIYGDDGQDTIIASSFTGNMYGGNDDDLFYSQSNFGNIYGDAGNDRAYVVNGYSRPSSSLEYFEYTSF